MLYLILTEYTRLAKEVAAAALGSGLCIIFCRRYTNSASMCARLKGRPPFALEKFIDRA